MNTDNSNGTARRAAFRPDYAVHPGEFIEEWISDHGATQVELADRIDMSTKQLNQIVRGHKPITHETALKLETVTSIPARFWNNAQALYEEDSARISQDDALAQQVDFLETLPVGALRRARFVTSSPRDKVGTLKQVLAFFGVATPDAWRRTWLAPTAAFRRSPAFTERPGATAAWLRAGELAARKIEVAPFDRMALVSALPGIRALTRWADFDAVLAELQRACASAGVALVVVPDVFGSRCSGATRWVAGRPLVQLSMRHRHDDHFWFTVFHELGHVLLHGRHEFFIDDGAATAEDRASEAEADAFAAKSLIADADAERLRPRMSLADIEAFSASIGVSAGIVVGRLQHEQLLPHTHGNGLKRRYDAPALVA